MKRVIIYGLMIAFLFAGTTYLAVAQEDTERVTLRTLSVDWYEYSGAGVKLQYRTFNDEPVILYLPASFERELFRFVDTPKEYGGVQSLPILLVHMKGQEVIFIDIYTRFMRTKGRISDFKQQDMDNFAAQEQKGKIELKFY